MPWKSIYNRSEWLREMAERAPLNLKKEPQEEVQNEMENVIRVKKKSSAVAKRIKKEPTDIKKEAVPKTRKRKATEKNAAAAAAVSKNIKKEPAQTVLKTRVRNAAAKAEPPDEAPKQETQSSISSPRRKRNRNTRNQENWIPNSRAFSAGVVDDIMSRLHNNLNDLTRTELRSLKQVQALWEQKFNVEERKPESNRTSSPPPKRKYKPTQKKTPKGKKVWKPAKERGSLYEDVERGVNYWHWDDLEDNEIVENRICVPPLKNKFGCRRFDIMMPAFAMKRNLVQPLFNMELLERIMSPPLEEGTKLLQQVVDEMLLQYQQGLT
ncbi:uncharacterized protein LOC111065345 [Drosophila obscura]|uniref:uncharacterized protein LOC111065345 n=1 Tax=Drosophila obscura TaxID=7282 RepID=UPI001BB235EA|nr:uncharacterized protein LOC111065345 [Drosophila obscura]